jgi:YggT family protein
MHIVTSLLGAYVWVIVIRALLSWAPHRPGSGLARLQHVFYLVTEPVLGPVRRLIPTTRIGGVGLDLSALLVVLAIEFVLIPILSHIG